MGEVGRDYSRDLTVCQKCFQNSAQEEPILLKRLEPHPKSFQRALPFFNMGVAPTCNYEEIAILDLYNSSSLNQISTNQFADPVF